MFCSGQVDTFVSTIFFAIGEKKLIWCSVRYLSEIVNVHQQFVCIVREFLGRTMARKSACHCYKQRLDVIKYYNIPTVLCVSNTSLSQLYVQHCGWTGGQSNVCKIRYDNRGELNINQYNGNRHWVWRYILKDGQSHVCQTSQDPQWSVAVESFIYVNVYLFCYIYATSFWKLYVKQIS